MAISKRVVQRKGTKLIDKLYIIASFRGLLITLGHFFRNFFNTSNIISNEYPEKKPQDITARYRGMHRLTKHKDGATKCVACFMCSTYCPANCIFIEAEERFDGHAEKGPATFNIDLLECVFCGLCVEACPHDAIRMDTGIFNKVGNDRKSFVVNKEQLLNMPVFEKSTPVFQKHK